MKQRCYFFGISCGSANEIIGCMDAAECAGLIEQEKVLQVKDVADHVARMLTKLRKRLSRAKGSR